MEEIEYGFTGFHRNFISLLYAGPSTSNLQGCQNGYGLCRAHSFDFDQVAYALSISEQTVKNHMSSILRKLSVNDRTQAVVYAMKQGWIRIPED